MTQWKWLGIQKRRFVSPVQQTQLRNGKSGLPRYLVVGGTGCGGKGGVERRRAVGFLIDNKFNKGLTHRLDHGSHVVGFVKGYDQGIDRGLGQDGWVAVYNRPNILAPATTRTMLISILDFQAKRELSVWLGWIQLGKTNSTKIIAWNIRKWW